MIYSYTDKFNIPRLQKHTSDMKLRQVPEKEKVHYTVTIS